MPQLSQSLFMYPDLALMPFSHDNTMAIVYITGLVVNYGISNTIVLEIP